MNQLPIGIFDSGVGGLTVMRQLIRILPKENILYFADTANLPYGEKSPEAIIHLVLENTALIEKKIKLLVIACHTASCHALKALQNRFSIPIIGMTEPALEELKKLEKHRIAVLGTSSTIESSFYQAQEIFPVACPLFVPFIEEGLFEHPSLESIAHHYLDPLLDKKITAVLLACTHYPLISPLLQKVFGGIQMIDPAEECAYLVRSRLFLLQLQNEQITSPVYEFHISGNREKFLHLAKALHLYPGSSKERSRDLRI